MRSKVQKLEASNSSADESGQEVPKPPANSDRTDGELTTSL